MPDLSDVEYKALRNTIRERGTIRLCLVLIGLAAWGALALGLLAADIGRAATLVPLVVLIATFELNFFVHTGVERVGRYLQVFYEEERGAAGWETLAMTYGRMFPGGLDPLFVTIFGSAGLLNFVTGFIVTARPVGWVIVSLAAHGWFGWRLMNARREAASQRALDLERFRTLRTQAKSSS